MTCSLLASNVCTIPRAYEKKMYSILIAMLRDVLYGFLSIFGPIIMLWVFSTWRISFWGFVEPSWTSCIFFVLPKVIYQRQPKTKTVVSSHFRLGKPCFGRCHEGGLNLHPAFSCTEYLSLAIYIEFVPGWPVKTGFHVMLFSNKYIWFKLMCVFFSRCLRFAVISRWFP